MPRRRATPTGQWVFAGAVLALLVVWAALEVIQPNTFIGPDGAVIAYVDDLDERKPHGFRTAAYVHHGKPQEASSEASAPAIESLVAIAATEQRDTLLGRTVHLRNLHVTEVTSDTTFFVRPADGTLQRPFLVVRADGLERGVERGSLVGIDGMVCGLPDDLPPGWALDPQEAALVTEERVYLIAHRVTFESPP